MGRAKRAIAEPPAQEQAQAAEDEALLSLLALGLRLQATEDRWRVSGNTLPHRAALRDAGGTWNRLDMCWEFTGADPTARLAAAIQAAPTLGHNSGNGAAPPKRTITAIGAACANGS
jgi:DNA repair protein RadC